MKEKKPPRTKKSYPPNSGSAFSWKYSSLDGVLASSLSDDIKGTCLDLAHEGEARLELRKSTKGKT
ncbi:hypothetical protein OZN62_13600 [Aurantiacibacter sp. MUD11]|uniref:hypothetical protein n=1 Tax=Aurantiacibacter sp. MUD11 TaxID=3003265 RepID=UPI0022AABA34|nr:hypothetical protein [Aurantiacibacter sp. MUD11]WAT17931.1 hypothetical protein OZN62_13600 [Aurantiacibacter sp. MUD11]